MDDGPIALVTDDGRKTFTHIIGLLGATGGNFLGKIVLAKLFARRQACFQPAESAQQGYTVFAHGGFEVIDLRVVFDGFLLANQVLTLLDAHLNEHLVQVPATGTRIDQNGVAGTQFGTKAIDARVQLHPDFVLLQLGINIGRHFGRMNEQVGFFQTHNQVRHKNGGVGNIATAQVEQPGDVFESTNQMLGAALSLHFGA